MKKSAETRNHASHPNDDDADLPSRQLLHEAGVAEREPKIAPSSTVLNRNIGTSGKVPESQKRTRITRSIDDQPSASPDSVIPIPAPADAASSPAGHEQSASTRRSKDPSKQATVENAPDEDDNESASQPTDEQQHQRQKNNRVTSKTYGRGRPKKAETQGSRQPESELANATPEDGPRTRSRTQRGIMSDTISSPINSSRGPTTRSQVTRASGLQKQVTALESPNGSSQRPTARKRKRAQGGAASSSDNPQAKNKRTRLESNDRTKPTTVDDGVHVDGELAGSARVTRGNKTSRPPKANQNTRVGKASGRGKAADATADPEVSAAPQEDQSREREDTDDVEESSEEGQNVEDESDEGEYTQLWYGEGANIRKAFHAIEKIGKFDREQGKGKNKKRVTGNARPKKLETARMNRLRNACVSFKNQLSKSDKAFEEKADTEKENLTDDETSLQASWRAILSKSRLMLDTDNNEESGKLVQDLYAHAIPTLTGTLWAVFQSYDRTPTLQPSQLTTALTLLKLIAQLADVAESLKKEYPLSSELAIVKPTNNILIPLRTVRKRFERELQAHKNRARAAHEQSHTRARRQIAQAREQLLQTHARALQAWKAEWRTLHALRQRAELSGRAFAPHARLLHVRDTDVESAAVREFDYAAAEVDDAAWTAEADRALLDGLDRFAGKYAYRWIVEIGCRRARPDGDVEWAGDGNEGLAGKLCAFNVVEIVARAVWWKEMLVRDCEAQGVEVEEWVRKITDPRARPGMTPEMVAALPNGAAGVERNGEGDGGDVVVDVDVQHETQARMDEG